MAEKAREQKRGDPAFTSVFVLIAVATACAAVLVVMPRAVEPSRLPPLVLDRAEVAQALARDARLAARAPRSAQVDELYGLYLDEGRAERAGQAGIRGTPKRRLRIHVIAEKLFAQLGESGVVALRARAVERFVQAYRGKLADQDEAAGLLGTFPKLLEQYALVDEDGELRAPELSMRAMYKARWNIIHELDVHYGLERMDMQAYEGWNALHAGRLKPAQRAKSAELYREAQGHRADEVLGIWLYQGGMVREALSLFNSAHTGDGQLVTRNYALYARGALAEQGME